MAKNILYHFLLGFELDALEQGIKIEHDVNKNNVAYYRIPLPENDSFNTLTLKLLNHHISIYCNESDSNPFLSQYHYTGHFADSQGNTWRSHVFYNERDAIIHSDHSVTSQLPPCSSSYAVEESLIKPPFSEEHVAYIAEAAIKPIMSTLRTSFISRVNALEQDYQRLENEACLLSAAPHGEKYKAKLFEVRAVLQKLSPLVRHSYYEAIQKFINCLLDNLKTRAQTPIDSSEPERFSAPQDKSISFFSAASSSVPKKSKELPSLDRKIDAFAQHFASLKHESLEVRSRLFPDLYSSLNAFYLPDAFGKTSPLSEKELIQLHQLHSELISQGAQDFKFCLLKGSKAHFELASNMKIFHQLLSVQNLELALHIRGKDLLDFILQYGDKSLLKMSLNVRSKSFRSPVHACIDLHSPAMSMQDCLSVLLKHGASLYQRAENGLPLGHVILSDKTSSLRRALPSTLLDSPEFFTHLIATLSQRLQSLPDLTEYERLNLRNALKEYKYKKINAEWVRYLQQFTASRSVLSPVDNNSAVKYIQEEAPVHLRKVMDDLDFLRTDSKKRKLEIKYLSLCTEQDRYQWLLANGNYLKIAVDVINELNVYKELVNLMPYEMFKEHLVNSLAIKTQEIETAINCLLAERTSGKRKPSSRRSIAGELLTKEIQQEHAALNKNIGLLKMNKHLFIQSEAEETHEEIQKLTP